MSKPDWEQLTLYPEDSPASRFPWPESSAGRKTSGFYGLKCSALSGSLGRIASSVRTYLESSALPPGRWSRIWSVKAITSSCLILKLRLSELGTGGQDAFLWGSTIYPTIKASDSKGTGPMGSRSAEHDLQRKNMRGCVLYATPCRGDATGTDVNGQLNPEWAEWLMGFPAGWSELDPSAMQLFRSRHTQSRRLQGKMAGKPSKGGCSGAVADDGIQLRTGGQ